MIEDLAKIGTFFLVCAISTHPVVIVATGGRLNRTIRWFCDHGLRSRCRNWAQQRIHCLKMFEGPGTLVFLAAVLLRRFRQLLDVGEVYGNGIEWFFNVGCRHSSPGFIRSIIELNSNIINTLPIDLPFYWKTAQKLRVYYKRRGYCLKSNCIIFANVVMDQQPSGLKKSGAIVGHLSHIWA